MLGKTRHALSLLAITCAVSLAPTAVRQSAAARAQATSPPNLAYIAGGHLWVQPVDGGPRRQIRTPWPMYDVSDSSAEIQWSPDGQRIALSDDKARLAVIKLATGHVTMLRSRACRANCNYPSYAWSPSGRYLAVLAAPVNGEYSHGTLSVWDSSLGTSRRLLSGVATYFGGLDWSHDSTRLVVGTGKLDLINDVYPSATIVDLQGHRRVLGPGTSYGWSPDDRFIGIVRSHTCGANTCDDDELVRPAAGGRAVTLISHIDSNFEDPEWAAQPGGYAFDRWLLGPAGNFAGRLAGPHERVDGWEPDGSHLAVQTYHPYEMTPDILYIATPQGSRVRLYTDGENAGCGACSKGGYWVTWSQNGKLVAFVTPAYPTPKLVPVNPKLFLTSIDGGTPTRIPVPGAADPSVLGFVDNDQELVIYGRTTIYRYVIATGSLTVLATHVITPPVLEGAPAGL